MIDFSLSRVLFAWVYLFLLTNSCVCLGDNFHIRSVENNWTRYRDNARRHATTSRSVELNSVLKDHYGVYKDKDRNLHSMTSKTVIVIVQLIPKQTHNPRPKMALLNNMICHLQRLGLMSVVYLSRYLFNSTLPVHSHFVPNENVLYMPYPDYSFWDMLVTRSKITSTPAKQQAKYSYPNVKEYGDKAVLFAVLEMMKANLDVILLDDDVMLLRNPIPFLINNHITADIVTPEDTRHCVFLANPLFSISKWRKLQPEINLGVTYFRSRHLTVQLVQRWLNLVHLNGQKAFSPFRHMLEVDNSCHTRHRLSLSSNSNTSLISKQPNRVSICYLSNSLFQNGFVNSFRCGKYNRNPVYLLTISEEILAHKDSLVPNNSIPKNFNLEFPSSVSELEVITSNAGLDLLTPVTVHPNYENKELTIKNYHFWLFETDSNSDSSNGDVDQKVCKMLSTSQNNVSYVHLYDVIQKRKVEAKKFQENTSLGIVPPFYYATEALPTPDIVFRFLSNTGMFEVFDIVPNTFHILSSAAGTTRDDAIADIQRCVGGCGNCSAVRVNVTKFSILAGDTNHHLVATYPVVNYSNTWNRV